MIVGEFMLCLFIESNLTLLASLLPDRANYLNPKELQIHHADGFEDLPESKIAEGSRKDPPMES
jgi:hypothetical protein